MDQHDDKFLYLAFQTYLIRNSMGSEIEGSICEETVASREICDDGLCFLITCSRCNPNNEPSPDGGDYILPSEGTARRAAKTNA